MFNPFSAENTDLNARATILSQLEEVINKESFWPSCLCWQYYSGSQKF